MKKTLSLIIVFFFFGIASAADKGTPPPPTQGTASDLSTGTDTSGKSWSAKDLAETLASSTVVTDLLGDSYDNEAKLNALMSITQTSSADDAGTITPTAGYKHIDIAWAPASDPSAISIGETGAINNAIIVLTNVGSNTGTIAYVAANFEFPGGASGDSLTMLPGNSVTAQYQTDRWRVIDNNTSTQFITSIEIPSYAHFASADATYSDTSTPHVLLPAEIKNTIITNYGATEDRVYTLQAMEFGVNFIFQVGAPYQMDLEPASGEAIWLNGTQASADEHIINAGDTEGETMTCYSVEVANGSYELFCNSSYANFAEATP